MNQIQNISTKLQLFYQYILDIYNGITKINPNPEIQTYATPKWYQIAIYMNDNSYIIVDTFNAIRKTNLNSNIKLNYQVSFSQLQLQISNEDDSVRKISFIVTALHHIIYDLMSQENNYYFTLDGKKEMDVLTEDIIYYINISIKNIQNIYFHAFFLLYSLESLFNKYFYVGVDFEFTNKKIQLAQLNFEHSVAKKSFIMIISPNELEPPVMKNFIDLVMCNMSISKILHGSDSQDIPYVYNHMLAEDPKKIIKFTKSLIDTRFLCEYYKLNLDGVSEYKCSIYDEDPSRSAIYYFGVVTEQQQQNLADILESMPNPHDRQWNIHKMVKSQVVYAQYDVIFLKYFYYKMISMATENETNDLSKKSIMELYKHVLPELTQFIYLENNGITFLRNKCKEEVDVVNNYFIRKPNAIIKLIDVFNQVSVDIVTNNPNVDINRILRVNHFKSTVNLITRRMIYGHLSHKCKIYKDRATLWTDRLDNRFIIDFFAEMKFDYLKSMFQEINKITETRIRQICP